MTDKKRIEQLEEKLRLACLAIHLAVQTLSEIGKVLGIERMASVDYLKDVYGKVQP